MLTDREVISTFEMLRNEHLDVRTVTLGISLFDCASDDLGRFQRNVHDKISRLAGNLVGVCDEVAVKYGIPVVNKRVAVSPVAVAACPFAATQMVEIAATLDRVAREIGIDFIGGFGALVEKGMTTGDRALIEAIPQALAATERVCASVNVASTHAGINMDAVLLMGRTIKEAARLTESADGLACAKLCVFANIPQDVPFMAGAYLGVGEPDAVINVGVSGPGVVTGKPRAGPGPAFGDHQADGLQGHPRGRDHRQAGGPAPGSHLRRRGPFPGPHPQRGRQRG